MTAESSTDPGYITAPEADGESYCGTAAPSTRADGARTSRHP